VAPSRLLAVTLMQPTLVHRTFHREGWVYEEKVDGRRMVAHKDGAAVKLVSRTGIDHTRRFQAIVAAIRAMAAPTLVLDGEVAVFDRALISRFEWLRHHAPPDLATPPISGWNLASGGSLSYETRKGQSRGARPASRRDACRQRRRPDG